MRFLVVTQSSSAPPMEMVAPLIRAMQGWLDRHADKMDEVWGFAGIQGGGGILNVESADDLDAVMQEFPSAPFSQIQIYPPRRPAEAVGAVAAGGSVDDAAGQLGTARFGHEAR